MVRTVAKLNVAVLGDGGWGTTLAILLERKGFAVTLWGAFGDYSALMARTRRNPKFLPGVRIPGGIEITSELKKALAGKDLIVLAVPSQYLRGVLKKTAAAGYPRQAVFLSVAKGIEIGTLKRMSEVVRDELGAVKFAVLSGPTIAHEVSGGVPSVAVAASTSPKVAGYIQDVFMSGRFRIYTNKDVAGVELGGSLKNIIAIACGISDGLGFGTNTKAAILSRGLAEISRLGQAMGAKTSTFSGISGLGDLVTTCVSPFSRNRFVGQQLGKGCKPKVVQSKMQMVAEGVPTAKSAYALAKIYKVDMPITREVYLVLYKNKPALAAFGDLMRRKKKQE